MDTRPPRNSGKREESLESLSRSAGRLQTRLRQYALRSKQTAVQDKKLAPSAPPKPPATQRKPPPQKPPKKPAAKRPVPPHLKQYLFQKKPRGK